MPLNKVELSESPVAERRRMLREIFHHPGWQIVKNHVEEIINNSNAALMSDVGNLDKNIEHLRWMRGKYDGCLILRGMLENLEQDADFRD